METSLPPEASEIWIDPAGFLRKMGVRATSTRISLLKTLTTERVPLSVSDIKKKIGKGIDLVTIYRTLELFVARKLANRIDWGRGPLYEIAAGRDHHHHAVCTTCGVVEDVPKCNAKGLERSARSELKKFFLITGHSLEFFGVCRKCNMRATITRR